MLQAPNISESISKSFIQDFNIFLLYSQSLELSLSLAKAFQLDSLKSIDSLSSCSYAKSTIIVDMSSSLKQQIDYHLHCARQTKILDKQNYLHVPKQILELHKTTKQKRQKLYLEGGIFSVSASILLLDLLTKAIRPLQIRRLILFHRSKSIEGKLQDKYCYLPWIATLVTIQAKTVPIVLVSNQVPSFQRQNLENVVRLMFIKKVVIWPFGRSQIQSYLKINKECIRKINHCLPLHETQKQLIDLYKKLRDFFKLGKSASHSPQYSQLNNNRYDSKSLQFLEQSLLLYSKLQHLIYLECVTRESSESSGSIWNSNNFAIMEIIQKINKLSAELVYTAKHKDSMKRKINLYQLMAKYTKKKSNNKQLIASDGSSNSNSNKGQQNKQNPSKHKGQYFEELQEQQSNQEYQNSLQSAQNIKIIYELQYQITVYGLDIIQKQQSPFFSPKFIQIVKYFSTLNSFDRDDQYLPAKQNSQSIYKFDMKQGSQINEKKESDNILNERYQQNQQQVMCSQKIHADTPRKKQSSSVQKIQEQLFRKYTFSKQKVFKYVAQKQLQKNTLPHNQNNKLQPEIDLKQKIRLSPKIYKLQQFLPDYKNIAQKERQQVVYLQTISQDSVKNLKRQIFAYQNMAYYRQYIRLFLKYLQITKNNRLKSIKKAIKKIENDLKKEQKAQKKMIHNPQSKNNTFVQNKCEQQAILLQQIYQQLSAVQQIIVHYEAMVNIDVNNQVQQLFYKQIQSMYNNGKIRYLRKQMLVLIGKQFNVKDDCILKFKENGLSFIVHIHHGENLSYFSRNLRVLCPDMCIFYNPSPLMARHLIIKNAQNNLQSVRQAHVLLFENSYQVDNLKQTIIEEDKAFWNIGQVRHNLGQFTEDPVLRKDQLFIDDDIAKKQKMINLAMNMDLDKTKICQTIKVTRTILVDKRQFKSMLPSYLYHHGFEVIPVFLDIGDYILSNSLAIQKKSVQTRDLHESIKSGRLADQLRRMSLKFAKPYLLIQCSDISYFSKAELNYGVNSITGERYQVHIRRQLIKILNRFPKVQVIWSIGYLNTIQIVKQLKKNQLEPEVNKFKPISDADELDDFQDENEQKIFIPTPLQDPTRKQRRSKANSQIQQIKQQNHQDQ